MKKNLLLVLMFAGLAASTQAQNTYFNIINYPAAGGRFVIPYNASFDLLATNSRTYTFRMMVPTGTPASANNTNYARIFSNADSPSTTGGLGLTFSTLSTTVPRKDIRVLDQSSEDGLNYGNQNNNLLFGTLNDGNWHHIAVVYNDNSDLVANPTRKAKVFFDGVFLAYASNGTNVKTGPIKIAIESSNTVFGSASTGGSAISAAFDDIRIWDHSLTPAEVATDVTAVINATTAPTTPGLLAAYNFESSTIGIVGGVPDITGKTNAGQAVVNLTTVFATGSSTPTLSNKKFDKNTINVYLDAQTSILAISAPEANASISVVVYDLLGKMVASSKSNDNTAKISMSNVSSGVYLVNVTDGFTSYTQKIVKN